MASIVHSIDRQREGSEINYGAELCKQKSMEHLEQYNLLRGLLSVDFEEVGDDREIGPSSLFGVVYRGSWKIRRGLTFSLNFSLKRSDHWEDEKSGWRTLPCERIPQIKLSLVVLLGAGRCCLREKR
ncbi:hypothetical protein KSP40_PGU005455 [Platanthera guangdongensis]|uniref:Uncharacterized protein n=1 Tax=Platanthera guangdongensis TaxID=2320717 RepID=A0ABR2MM53_9ASPA